MPEKGMVFSGCRAIFSLNGVEVGYGTSVSVSESIDYQAVEVLDCVEVAEFVPTGYRTTLSANRVRIVGDTLKSNGWFPNTGKNTIDHLLNILNAGDLSATISDRKTGKILATLQQVRVTDHSWQVAARGIVAEDVSFCAVRMVDESEI